MIRELQFIYLWLCGRNSCIVLSTTCISKNMYIVLVNHYLKPQQILHEHCITNVELEEASSCSFKVYFCSIGFQKSNNNRSGIISKSELPWFFLFLILCYQLWKLKVNDWHFMLALTIYIVRSPKQLEYLITIKK